MPPQRTAQLPSDTVAIKTQTSVPDSRFGTRQPLSHGGKHEHGVGSVAVQQAMSVDKPAQVVGNVNKLEVRRNGVDSYTQG